MSKSCGTSLASDRRLFAKLKERCFGFNLVQCLMGLKLASYFNVARRRLSFLSEDRLTQQLVVQQMSKRSSLSLNETNALANLSQVNHKGARRLHNSRPDYIHISKLQTTSSHLQINRYAFVFVICCLFEFINLSSQKGGHSLN